MRPYAEVEAIDDSLVDPLKIVCFDYHELSSQTSYVLYTDMKRLKYDLQSVFEMARLKTTDSFSFWYFGDIPRGSILEDITRPLYPEERPLHVFLASFFEPQLALIIFKWYQ